MFRVFVPLPSVLFVRYVCSGACMPCSGTLFRHPSVLKCLVRYVCSTHCACLFWSCVPLSDCIVCSLRLFGGLRVLFRYIVPTSECLFVTCVRNMLSFRLSVPEFCSRVCSDCLVCSFSLFGNLHALCGCVRVYCSDIRVVCSLRLLETC